jgi:hypothetical protein
MDTRLFKTTLLLVIGLMTLGAAGISSAAKRSLTLTQDPLVMRLSKDEFRIAFGINADRGAPNGCNGVIRYRVDWKTEDGMKRSDVRQVNYAVLPHASRAMTVDRQYFDTGEGQHTTDVVKVSVDRITCLESGDARTPQVASATAAAASSAAERLQ